jgi:ATP-binding cassette subfamily C protein
MRFEGSYLAEETKDPSKFDLPFEETLRLREVTYSYPSSQTPVVQDVSLEIPRGGFVSFCGTSGGGKSTLALLLMGLLRPQEGQVLCDGLDVFHHIRSWHRKIGYVGQNMYLSKRSIRENVAFTVPEEQIDDERVWAALRLASAHGFVRKLPERLRYRLAEGGANLSGGQRQRLIIARALYSDPEIIVFDEATAALDNVTERAIAKSIAELSQTKTIICIAHRLSTIANSDVIHVVEAGKITASGNFDALMQTSATFQKLANEEKKKKRKKEQHSLPEPHKES